MNRKTKNIIMSVSSLLIIVLMGVTVYFASTDKLVTNTNNSNVNIQDNKGGPDMKGNNTPPDINQGNDNNSNNNSNDGNTTDDNNNNGNNNNGNRPTPPNGEGRERRGNGGPPGMDRRNNTNNNNSSDSANSTSNDNINDDNAMTMMKDMPNDNNLNTPPDGNMPNFNNTNDNATTTTSSIKTYYYVIFAVESLILVLILMYLIMSNLNKKDIKKTFNNMDKVMIYILSSILLTALLTTCLVFSTNLVNSSNSSTKTSTTTTTSSGVLEVSSKKKLTSGSYKSTESDQNAILVKDGGNLNASNITVNKKGDSNNTENADFTGVNAGILVEKNSSTTIKNAKIKTNGKGANAVFATGSGATINISDSTITTTGESSSRGLDATYGGKIVGDNLTITTSGASSASLATDRGEGTVTVTNSKLTTSGKGSPLIYSTGDISVSDTEGNAKASQIVVVEGKNSATITSSKLTASGAGNRGDNGDVDQAGVMIYQSMSGDAEEGEGTFVSKDSTLTIDKDSSYYKTAPMFFVTNTTAKINLTNTKLEYGSNTLLSVKATSEWGSSGSNGGNVTFNLSKEDVSGNIEIDNISTLDMSLTNSKYTGTINGSNTAKSISLKLDKKSTITLTGDSYVTSLDDADSSYSNINFNGYKLYVNGTAIN